MTMDGFYRCTNCGNTELFEREVLCWTCGKGEMVWIPTDENMAEKDERNARVQSRYNHLMREGKHGHYETMFRVVREEVERALATVSSPAT